LELALEAINKLPRSLLIRIGMVELCQASRNISTAFGHYIQALSEAEMRIGGNTGDEQVEKGRNSNLETADTLNAWSNLLSDMYDGKGALKKAIEAANQNPWSADIYNNIGLAFNYTDNPLEARKAFQMAAGLNNNNIQVKLNLADFDMNSGNLGEAARLIEEAFKIDQKSPDVHISLAWLALNRGRIEDAKAETAKARSLNPESPYALSASGVVEFRDGNLDAGNSFFAKAIQEDQSQEPIWAAWGEELLSVGDLGAGIEKLSKSLSLNAHFARAYADLAGGLKRTGKSAEGIDLLEKGLNDTPGTPTALSQWGDMLFDRNDIDGGNGRYQEAVKANPSLAWL
jgi:tetratricopeptide (TPR) repeat protein